MSTAPADGLLAQGHSYAAKDDVRAAASYYQAALKAAQQGGAIDPAGISDIFDTIDRFTAVPAEA